MPILALATLLVPEAAYRWRRVPIGNAPVTAVALPPTGRRAFFANGEGYVLRDVAAPTRIPMDAVTGVSLGAYAPGTVVAVGEASTGGNVRFSLDGGTSWRPCPMPPALQGGRIAVSSDGRTWLWSTAAGTARTEDYGFAWSSSDGLPDGAKVVADRTSSRRFYALASDSLYVSDDGGRNFSKDRLGLPPDDAPVDLVPTPGRVGDLWLLARKGLYHARPGLAFTRVPGVANPVAMSIGVARAVAAPGPLPLALYVAAEVEGHAGLFRSDDEGVRWSSLVGAPQDGASVHADPSSPGRVYVALRDGGVVVGAPG